MLLLINGPRIQQFSCPFHQLNYLFFRAFDIKFTKVMKVLDLHVHVDTLNSVKYLGKQFNLVISLFLFFLCRTLEKI